MISLDNTKEVSCTVLAAQDEFSIREWLEHLSDIDCDFGMKSDVECYRRVKHTSISSIVDGRRLGE